MNLQYLREYIRVQLDMDEEELPNALLDSYLHEGFLRMISMESRWPFYETEWAVAKVPDTESIVLPANCDPPGITVLEDADNKLRLFQLGSELALDRFSGQIGAPPTYYSIRGDRILLWPKPATDTAYNYIIFGHRKPEDWITAGPDAEVDADIRLHILLAHYAIALVYAMEEDEVLEDTYMKRFQAGFIAARSAICEPRHHRPLIFNGGTPVMPQYTPVEWNLPA